MQDSDARSLNDLTAYKSATVDGPALVLVYADEATAEAARDALTEAALTKQTQGAN